MALPFQALQPASPPARPQVVLMGDIIGSRKLPDAAGVASRFAAVVDQANLAFLPAIASPLTITLGDEFQGITAGYRAAFEIANRLRLTLLQDGIACRFCLGAARLVTPLNPERAWGMSGPGLAEVRTRLNTKNDLTAYQFVLPPGATGAELLEAVAIGLTLVEEGWTPGQRDAVLSALQGETADAMAARLKVTPRAIRKQLQGADNLRYQHLRAAVLGELSRLDH